MAVMLASKMNMDVQDEQDKRGLDQCLNPIHCEPYERKSFIEALQDWGWFGNASSAPGWYRGRMRNGGDAID
jgi:hypothetical protein